MSWLREVIGAEQCGSARVWCSRCACRLTVRLRWLEVALDNGLDPQHRRRKPAEGLVLCGKAASSSCSSISSVQVTTCRPCVQHPAHHLSNKDKHAAAPRKQAPLSAGNAMMPCHLTEAFSTDHNPSLAALLPQLPSTCATWRAAMYGSCGLGCWLSSALGLSQKGCALAGCGAAFAGCCCACAGFWFS